MKKWQDLKILIACEFSGRVRDAFIKEGFDTISCDILNTESAGPHIQGDVLDILNKKWDTLIGFPPCTYLCNSGVRWLYDFRYNNGNLLQMWDKDKTYNINQDRWDEMKKASEFFLSLLNSDIKHICLENPIQHKFARNTIRKYDQIIHPWEHGHSETKQTCLWLKNLPKITPTNIVTKGISKIHNMSPSKDRSKKRSLTYNGIAEAFANQFGNYLKGEYP